MNNTNTYTFSWKDLGDIALGRPNLGNSTYVMVYRLMKYTLKSVLENEFGPETAKKIFYKAGELAGKEFCKNLLDTKLEFSDFIGQLSEKLVDLKIGILKIEKTDLISMHFTFVVEEDLDCSGLPFDNQTVCDYDEGFIAGILKEYTGKNFNVKEIDCWASGERVCRFDITLNERK